MLSPVDVTRFEKTVDVPLRQVRWAALEATLGRLWDVAVPSAWVDNDPGYSRINPWLLGDPDQLWGLAKSRVSIEDDPQTIFMILVDIKILLNTIVPNIAQSNLDFNAWERLVAPKRVVFSVSFSLLLSYASLSWACQMHVGTAPLKHHSWQPDPWCPSFLGRSNPVTPLDSPGLGTNAASAHHCSPGTLRSGVRVQQPRGRCHLECWFREATMNQPVSWALAFLRFQVYCGLNDTPRLFASSFWQFSDHFFA